MLSDPGTYLKCIPESRQIRSADPDWPAEGSRFEHAVGYALLRIPGDTRVVRALEPVRLELRVTLLGIPAGRVVFDLQPEGEGTRVTLTEEPDSRVLTLLIGPLGHAVIRLRNSETLSRLKELAEGVTEPDLARAAARNGA